ncbi:MAG: energy transducer TonB [Flavobacteriales bacterium]|jgi:TonB family protein|nr:energy transducer TonB [Flavobacteriales bacterium]MDP4716411.1 energy transducer TonB [Flavobacteriales bacterium]MDP4730720.1 energy transducer TonB [Flavobacteriales bacterium]MDP4818047.1 energy transducer TonB [Flavobacteriales bacterium]MDP4950155.1 energy transducer TonB [Flavobacteriales bacterium]
MTEQKKNKIIGAATSGGVHLLILFVVFLLLASSPPVEKEEDPGGGGGGNPVGAGEGSAEGEAGGAIQPVEIAFAPMPETYVGADISAPTISESKTPVEHTNKPSTDKTQTAQTNPQPSALDNMLNQLNGGGGSDASNGGGNGGSGGGTGGGDGGGNGPGSGNFTGTGFGNGTSWSLKGRGSLSGPSTNKKPTANGEVVVSITVDKNGKVTKATVAKSNITTDVAFNHGLAIEAAKKCSFTPSSNSMPQNGTITIVLAVK